jgi:flagellar hook-length control protein FliK
MSTPATPAKSTVGKPAGPKDAKPADAQSAASAALAAAPLIAGGFAAQTTSQGSSANAAAAGADSSSDAATDDAASAPPVAAGSSGGGHGAVTPALAAAVTPPRQSAAPGASAPLTLGEDSSGTAAAPDSGSGSAAPLSAPFHAALQSALSAATRLDGAAPSPAASQTPGTSNELASANGALSQTAAPAGADQTGASAAPQTGAPVTVQLHAEVGSGGWADELGTRLHWMANAGLGSASLRLTPEQLGPIEVKISVHQNAASVWFSAAQPDTRSALEQALPRLKELFSAQGLNLAQAGVSDQSARSAAQQRDSSGERARASAARELSATSVTSAVRLHQGLIDTYA